MYEYKAKLRRVIDGDTIDLDIDLGFRMTARIRIRLDGVDTPEIRGPERPQGLEARKFVVGWLRERPWLIVHTKKTGKYSRWLGKVWGGKYMSGDKECLNYELIRKGWRYEDKS